MKNKCCKFNLPIGIIFIILSPFVMTFGGGVGILFLLTGIFALISLKKGKNLPVGMIAVRFSLNIYKLSLDLDNFNYYDYIERYFIIYLPSLKDNRLNYSILSICKDNLNYFYYSLMLLPLYTLLMNTLKWRLGKIISSSIVLFLSVLFFITSLRAYVQLFNCYGSLHYIFYSFELNLVSLIEDLFKHGIDHFSVDRTLCILYVRTILTKYVKFAALSVIIVAFTIYLSLNTLNIKKHCKERRCELE